MWREHNPALRWLHRLHTGAKPSVNHSSHRYDKSGSRIDWKHMEPAAIRQVHRDLSNWMLLWIMRDGTIPEIDHVIGVPKVQYFLPILVDANRLGFRAAPALRTDQPAIMPSRFGAGVGALLTLGNYTAGRLDYHAATDNAFLGDHEAYLLSGPYGQPVPCAFTNGQTMFRGSLAGFTPAAYRVQFGLSAQGVSGRGEVRQDYTPSGLDLHATLSLDDPSGFKASAFVPDDFHVMAVDIDGEAVDFDSRANAVSFAVDRPLRTARVHVRMQSQLFSAPWRRYLDFPFVQGETLCTIVRPDSEAYADARAGRRMQEYFRFWYAEEKSSTVELPVRDTNEPLPDGPLVFLGAELTGAPRDLAMEGIHAINLEAAPCCGSGPPPRRAAKRSQ